MINQQNRYGKRKHRYYRERDAISEAESRDMWREREKRTIELSKKAKAEQNKS